MPVKREAPCLHRTIIMINLKLIMHHQLLNHHHHSIHHHDRHPHRPHHLRPRGRRTIELPIRLLIESCRTVERCPSRAACCNRRKTIVRLYQQINHRPQIAPPVRAVSPLALVTRSTTASTSSAITPSAYRPLGLPCHC